MSKVGGFFSHLWRVYYPEFESAENFSDVKDKPEAKLAKDDQIEYGQNDLSEDEVKQVGVAIAEATYALSGYTWYATLIVLWVSYFIYSLDNQTALNLGRTAIANLEADQNDVSSKYASSYSAQMLFVAVSKLFVAKLADIFGRSAAVGFTMFFYTLGFLIMAVSQTGNDYIAGSALYGIGNSGLQIVIWIILADVLSARFRVLGYGFITFPVFITFVVGSKIVGALALKWRWIPGMFCILVPVVLTPLLVILLYLEHKAKKSKLVPRHPYLRKGYFNASWQFILDVDLVGLLLLIGGFAMIVVALTGASTFADSTWSSDWVIACFVVGPVILVILLPLYEWFIAPRPFLRLSWMNSDVLIAFIVGFFDNMVFQAGFQVLYGWAFLSHGYKFTDLEEVNYLNNSDLLALTLFGAIAGVIIMFTRRFKWFLVAGAVIRTIGFGLQLKYRTNDAAMVQVVWGQIVQGIGGAFLGEITTLLSQVTVRHQDVAMVTGVYLTLFSLGSSIGQPIYQALLNAHWPQELDKYATLLSPEERQIVVDNGPSGVLTAGPMLDQYPDKKAQVGMAFNEASRHVLYFCIGVSAALIIITLFVRDWVLPRSHNVVSDELPEKNPFRMASDPTYDYAIEHAANINEEENPKQYDADVLPSSPSDQMEPEFAHHSVGKDAPSMEPRQGDIIGMGIPAEDAAAAEKPIET